MPHCRAKRISMRSRESLLFVETQNSVSTGAQREALARFLEKEKSYGHHQSQGRNPAWDRILVRDMSMGSYREGFLYFTRANSLPVAHPRSVCAISGK